MANMKVVRKVVQFSMEKQLPVILWGEAGVGKTDIVGQASRDLKYNLVTLHLATQDVADLIGVPQGIDGRTVYAKPSWFIDSDSNPTQVDVNRPTVYFLDEFNRGSRPVLAAMLPFLLTGKIHEHTIRKDMGDCVIAACNFSDDDYDVTELSDKALRDRCGHVIVRPEADEFLDFSKGVLDDNTWEMIKANPEIVNIAVKELDFKVEPSRRKLCQVMPHFKDKDMDWVQAIGLNILQAYLGEDFATIWFKNFKKRDNGLTVEEILARTKETVEKISRLTTGDVRVDILEITNSRLVKHLQNKKTKVTEEQAENLFHYIFSLPPDILRNMIEVLEKDVSKIRGMAFGEFFWEMAEKFEKKEVITTLVRSYKE